MEAQGNVKSIKTTQWTPLIQQYTYLHRYHVVIPYIQHMQL